MASEDKLIRIFKQLRFEEQLSLASESARMRNVFENHIWKVNYKILEILKLSGGGFAVSNETHLDRVFLRDEETLRHFIEFYAENLKIVISDKFFDTKLFKNLISLNMTGSDVCIDEIIPIIAKNLEHLESLEICEFRTNDSIVKSETVSALLQMKKLKRLCLVEYPDAFILKYKQFCQIASKLETLKISAKLEPDEDYGNSETDHATFNSDQLKELEICTTFDPSNWTHKYLEFLSTFKSLTTLSIKITDKIDNCLWSIFVTYCQELKKLTISHTNFKNITYFFVPPKLIELKLIRCKGLSYTNLKQILQDAKLTEFSSLYTSYDGEFNEFKIASTIRTLDISGIYMREFPSVYDRNENLKNLRLGQTHENCTNTECKSLAVCKNLETVYLRPLNQVTLNALLQLYHLRELNISIDDSTHWSLFIDLLKHSSLSELTVYIGVDVNITPTKGLQTNISTLKVDYSPMCMDEFGLDFFLDLFSQNPDLQLSFGTIHVVKLLKLLINHRNFPRNLKTIIANGFTMNCDDLRRNFDDTIKFGKTYHPLIGNVIVLCRNQSVN